MYNFNPIRRRSRQNCSFDHVWQSGRPGASGSGKQSSLKIWYVDSGETTSILCFKLTISMGHFFPLKNLPFLLFFPIFSFFTSRFFQQFSLFWPRNRETKNASRRCLAREFGWVQATAKVWKCEATEEKWHDEGGENRSRWLETENKGKAGFRTRADTSLM